MVSSPETSCVSRFAGIAPRSSIMWTPNRVSNVLMDGWLTICCKSEGQRGRTEIPPLGVVATGYSAPGPPPLPPSNDPDGGTGPLDRSAKTDIAGTLSTADHAVPGRGPDSFRYQAESAWADSQGTVYRAGVQVELG